MKRESTNTQIVKDSWITIAAAEGMFSARGLGLARVLAMSCPRPELPHASAPTGRCAQEPCRTNPTMRTQSQ